MSDIPFVGWVFKIKKATDVLHANKLVPGGGGGGG